MKPFKKSVYVTPLILICLAIIIIAGSFVFFQQRSISSQMAINTGNTPTPVPTFSSSALASPSSILTPSATLKPKATPYVDPSWKLQKNNFFSFYLPSYLKDNNGGSSSPTPLDYHQKSGLADVQFWQETGNYSYNDAHPEIGLPFSAADCYGNKGDLNHFTITFNSQDPIDAFTYTNLCGVKKIDAILKESYSTYWYISSNNLQADDDFESIVQSVVFSQ